MTRAHQLEHPCRIERPADEADYFEDETSVGTVAGEVWLRIRAARPYERVEGERTVDGQGWVVYGYTRDDWQEGDRIEWTTTRDGRPRSLLIRSIEPAKNERMQRLRCTSRPEETAHAAANN